jgi:hypothetical protein
MIYEFAIKKEILNSGKEIFSPIVRKKTKKWLYSNNWERISCIYGKYTLIPLDWDPELSYEQCLEHIKGYQEKLKQDISREIQTVEFHNLEEIIL